ncbi:hypothetical protein BDK92_4834 [Micromonospora pisi]|uniref:DUF308 domain-containing protein n=1 Tax=Micromonospora pisi TaxID=589240 RepID=A0A495JNP8_9ACTN|nr:hypothetical protein [Micromonospora pisi]RKR90461.1 hypothetical protein BDK92_4834 [Micromonospora pisi]
MTASGAGPAGPANARKVAEPGWVRVLIWGLFPLLGAGVIGGLNAITGWLMKLPWAPVKYPAKFVDDLPEPAATLGAVAIGLVAGLIVAVAAVHEQLAVTVAAERVTLSRGNGTVRSVDGADIALVFLDGKQLVLLDPAGAELAREKSDLDAEALREAFEAHGFRWVAEDPHRAEYRLWVAPVGDLPDAVNVLLAARQKALKEDKSGYASRIRGELGQLGYVVRDERKKHQYWRRVPDHPG